MSSSRVAEGKVGVGSEGEHPLGLEGDKPGRLAGLRWYEDVARQAVAPMQVPGLGSVREHRRDARNLETKVRKTAD